MRFPGWPTTMPFTCERRGTAFRTSDADPRRSTGATACYTCHDQHRNTKRTQNSSDRDRASRLRFRRAPCWRSCVAHHLRPRDAAESWRVPLVDPAPYNDHAVKLQAPTNAVRSCTAVPALDSFNGLLADTYHSSTSSTDQRPEPRLLSSDRFRRGPKRPQFIEAPETAARQSLQQHTGCKPP